VFDEDHQLVANSKGNIVNPGFVQSIRKGVYSNGDGGVQCYPFDCPIQFPKYLGIREKQGKDTVFILVINTHE
jgi:hypothetical protein